MKNYLVKNHLILLLIVTVVICTKLVLNSIDYQTWRICQGLNLAFVEILPKQVSDEIFIQSCSRDNLMDYLIKTPNSSDYSK
jgi:hypothetical protein